MNRSPNLAAICSLCCCQVLIICSSFIFHRIDHSVFHLFYHHCRYWAFWKKKKLQALSCRNIFSREANEVMHQVRKQIIKMLTRHQVVRDVNCNLSK